MSRVRSRLRQCARARGFSELSQTRLVTAASELARNLLQYAGSGEVCIDEVIRGASHPERTGGPGAGGPETGDPGTVDPGTVDPDRAAEADVGLRVSFQDWGPGIRDLSEALTDGYSSSGGLGLGLGGARRLMDEFDISAPEGQGTRIVVTQWRETRWPGTTQRRGTDAPGGAPRRDRRHG